MGKRIAGNIGCSEVCVFLSVCRFMYQHTIACPVCWCLVFKNNFFNYFFPLAQLVLAFGGFSLKNKERWKVVLGHVFALNPASAGAGASWSFPKQLLSACWDPLVSFSKAPMMLRGMVLALIRVRNSEYLQSRLAQDVKALDDISSWSSWCSFKVLGP